MTWGSFLSLMILALSTLSAQPLNWSQKCPQTSPTATGVMAYDAARSQIVMFDGQVTWVWDGSNWNRKSPTNSPGIISLSCQLPAIRLCSLTG